MQFLAGAPRRIFDVHHHIEPAPADGREGYDGEEDVSYRLGLMGRLGVRASVMTVSSDYDRPHGQAATSRQNDFVAWYRSTHPDRFPVAIGTVEPTNGISACLEEMRRVTDELALDGVVWEPSASGELINEPRTVR